MDRPVQVRRVDINDVTDSTTRYRYQNAFLHQHYQICRDEWLNARDHHDAVEHRYLTELGYGAIARSFPQEKPCGVFTMSSAQASLLVALNSVFVAGALDDVRADCRWIDLLSSLRNQALMSGFVDKFPTSGSSAFGTPPQQVSASEHHGFFMRLEESSAKDADFYAVVDCFASDDSPLYARALDLPWAQRRRFATEAKNQNPIPEVSSELPALDVVRGAGPHFCWSTVLAALVTDEKAQHYLSKHANEGTNTSLYLTPWNEAMDTSRELRVYCRNLRVVAIGSWDHAHVHEWLELLSTTELADLARRVALYVETQIISGFTTPIPENNIVIDVLVHPAPTLDDFSLVEAGGFGKFQATGSTLFHWLEDDIFDAAADSPIEMRVATAHDGEKLSEIKPVPKPDLVPI